MEASGLIGVWDNVDRTPQLFMSVPAGAIDATFSPDGRSVLTVGNDGRVRCWTIDGQLKWTSQGGHGKPARAVAVSSDLIVSGGEDGALRLWRQDGAPAGELLNAHEETVMSVAISPRGELASFGGDEMLRVWKRQPSVVTPGQTPSFEPVVLFKPERRRNPHGFMALLRYDTSWGWDHSVTFSPRGDLAAVLFDGSMRVWSADGAPRAVVANAHQGRLVRALSFLPGGDLVASAGFDSTVRVWNLDGSPHREATDAHKLAVFSVAFSPDGSRMATAGRDERVRLWTKDGARMSDFPEGNPDRIVTVAFARNVPVLAAADKSGGVRLWNLDGSARGAPLVGHEGLVQALAFSPQQDALVSAGDDGTLRWWDLNGKSLGRPATFAKADRRIRSVDLVFSPQGDALAVGTAPFALWNRGRLLWRRPLRAADLITSIAIAPHGDFIVTGSYLGDIQVWNRDGSERTPALKQRSEYIAALAMAPDGDYFAAVVGGINPVLTLFNLDGSPRGAPLEGHSGPIRGLAFAPGGTLVSGGDDGMLRLWTLPSGTAEVINVGLPINQLGFWGQLLWVRAGGESIFFYEADRTLRATMLLRRSAVLLYTPDGWYAGSGDVSRYVRVFDKEGQALERSEAARYLSPKDVLASLMEH
jgi:WD40 repeat protein